MNERLNIIYQRLLKREYRNLRSGTEYNFADEFAKSNVDLYTRSYLRLQKLAEAEKAILFEGDKIGFMRTVKKVPAILTNDEFDKLIKSNFLFDGGQVENISSDYEYTLTVGFDKRKSEITEKIKEFKEGSEEYLFLNSALKTIDAVYILSDKYKTEAKEKKCIELYNALNRVPRKAPESFYEALVFFRILNFMLWLNGNKHNTIGRFDVYMYPFYKKDIESKKITRDEAKEFLEELFISLNVDADLYPGIQQGDNGQSLVLGGCDKYGNEVFNDLSRLCLEASLELKLIDPKINLRVNKNTPDEIYYLGTLLTKQGLGFPQYSNDDVVIKALVDLGYELEDARDYVVAACWEFIIPKVAMDIPNIDALNFPYLVDKTIRENIKKTQNFDELLKLCRQAINTDVKRMAARVKNSFRQPSPFQSILMQGCIENAKDISKGAKYNNYGIHGAGIANAADALSAVKKNIYDNSLISKDDLIKAQDSNFEGYQNIRKLLLDAPKMGNNIDYADDIAIELLNAFGDSCKSLKNEFGGIFRAGTGTAMYYIWYSGNLGATADGRKAGEPFAANYSPALGVKLNGVLSVIQSFTKPDLSKVCNGGPLTIEFHDTLFKNEDGIKKVAALVKTFIIKKGHQIQLNAINRDTLLDAQIHPENHKNMIVRVWGWSGYFNELDFEYQNHIIKRLEFLS